MKTAFYSHSDCRAHDMGRGHPECPERLDAIHDHLLASGLDAAVERREAPVAELSDLALAHSSGFLAELRDVLLRVADSGDPGAVANAFCATRPPGHHATRDQAMGFCFFNNVAVAARHALDVRGLQRVAIIDFDVHHGNGTEDIVAGDDRILMASIFQHPLYPYSGAVPKGDNMVNVPVPPYTRGPAIRALIAENWIERLDAFKPQMIFVSAGFDAHRDDELGQLGLVEDDYRWITEQIKAIADKHASGRIVSCLEGGYNLRALARSVAAHVRVLACV